MFAAIDARFGAAKGPAPDSAFVVSRLLEHPTQLDLSTSRLLPPPTGVSIAEYEAALQQQLRRDLLDSPVPALDGRTPRQAAGKPALRPRLLELMKAHVRQTDEQNLKTGRTDDINGLLRVWFALVPPGAGAPDASYEAMDRALDRLEQGQTSGDVLPEDFVRLLDDCRQPNLLKTVFGDFMAMADELPKAARMTPEATVTSAIVLRYLIDALDEAVGRE